jgi:catechol 2,3-dioxygenase-like lactoylglutathione lyase family enzyme
MFCQPSPGTIGVILSIVKKGVTMEKSSFAKFHHVGSIVRDMNKALAQLAAIGIKPTGMPNGQDIMELQFKGEFKGKPAEWGMKICMVKVGEMDIELLQPMSGDSVLHEFINSGREGFHHIAYIADDVDKEAAALVKGGAKIVASGGTPRGNFYYLETGGSIIIELRG